MAINHGGDFVAVIEELVQPVGLFGVDFVELLPAEAIVPHVILEDGVLRDDFLDLDPPKEGRTKEYL